MYLQVEALESKLKQVEDELKKEREAHEKEKEGFVSPGESRSKVTLEIFFILDTKNLCCNEPKIQTMKSFL